MKSNVIFLSAVCAGMLAVAGCTSDQPDTVPPNAYVPEKTAQKQAAGPVPGKVQQDGQIEEVEFDIVSAPAPEKKAAKPAAAKPAAPKKIVKGDYETVYTVQSGDTLGGIAYRNHLTPMALASHNGINLDKPIRVGQKLRIPKVRGAKAAAAKTTATPAAAKKSVAAKTAKKTAEPADNESVYTIKNGDTLGGIAMRHHVRRRELEERNGLNDKSILRIGQKLIIPKASIKSAAKAKPAKKKAAAIAETNTGAVAVEEPAPASAPAAPVQTKNLTADDIIGSGDTVPGGEPAAAPAAAKASAPAPAAVNDGDTIGFCCTQDMTLQEVADAVGRDYGRLKKLNPNLSPTEKLKSGTTVQIYIF